MNNTFLPFALCCVVGAGVLVSNPRRPINLGFFAFSVLTCLWLWALTELLSPPIAHPVTWLRLVAALGAIYPLLLWWLKSCAVSGHDRVLRFPLKAGLPWAAGTLLLVAIGVSPWYIPAASTSSHHLVGPLHPAYAVLEGLMYITLFVSTSLELKKLEGIARIEVQTFLLGGIGGCFAAVIVTNLGPRWSHDAPLLVMTFYAMTAWAISTRRIFDARHLFLGAMRWITVIFVLGVWLWLWQRIIAPLLPPTLGYFSAVASAVGVYVVLEEPLRRLFSFGLVRRQRLTAETRRHLLIASREIAELQPLKDRLESILMEWSGGAFAELLTPVTGEPGLTGRGITLRDPAVLRALAAVKWATPESLARRRPTPDQEALLRFMAEHHISAIAARTAWSSQDLLLAACLGAKRRRQPYTYPECQDLLEWTDLAETAIARSMLTLQAKEAEHIATVGIMGASIAHEIRNPLVALSATAELLEEKHDDPEFRKTFSALIDREVGRIKTISEQLRRLSPAPDPQLVRVRLSQLIRECVELVQARAAKLGTELIFPSTVAEVDAMADAGALRQVLLNLLGNALDAVESKGPNGRIHVVVNTSAPPVVLIDVSDNGKGVSPQQRKRLFLPFASDKTNGFGLGLATSAKLMRSLHGTIALVDREGPGATFRLTLQCPPVAATSPAMS